MSECFLSQLEAMGRKANSEGTKFSVFWSWYESTFDRFQTDGSDFPEDMQQIRAQVETWRHFWPNQDFLAGVSVKKSKTSPVESEIQTQGTSFTEDESPSQGLTLAHDAPIYLDEIFNTGHPGRWRSVSAPATCLADPTFSDYTRSEADSVSFVSTEEHLLQQESSLRAASEPLAVEKKPLQEDAMLVAPPQSLPEDQQSAQQHVIQSPSHYQRPIELLRASHIAKSNNRSPPAKKVSRLDGLDGDTNQNTFNESCKGTNSQEFTLQDTPHINKENNATSKQLQDTCGNCNKMGHVLADCVAPVDEFGFISGCPKCNTKAHFLEDCSLVQGGNKQSFLFEALVKNRGNRPPIRWEQDFRDLPSFGKTAHRPWTCQFSLKQSGIFPVLYNKLTRRSMTLCRDPAWENPYTIPSQAYRDQRSVRSMIEKEVPIPPTQVTDEGDQEIISRAIMKTLKGKGKGILSSATEEVLSNATDAAGPSSNQDFACDSLNPGPHKTTSGMSQSPELAQDYEAHTPFGDLIAKSQFGAKLTSSVQNHSNPSSVAPEKTAPIAPLCVPNQTRQYNSNINPSINSSGELLAIPQFKIERSKEQKVTWNKTFKLRKEIKKLDQEINDFETELKEIGYFQANGEMISDQQLQKAAKKREKVAELAALSRMVDSQTSLLSVKGEPLTSTNLLSTPSSSSIQFPPLSTNLETAGSSSYISTASYASKVGKVQTKLEHLDRGKSSQESWPSLKSPTKETRFESIGQDPAKPISQGSKQIDPSLAKNVELKPPLSYAKRASSIDEASQSTTASQFLKLKRAKNTEVRGQDDFPTLDQMRHSPIVSNDLKSPWRYAKRASSIDEASQSTTNSKPLNLEKQETTQVNSQGEFPAFCSFKMQPATSASIRNGSSSRHAQKASTVDGIRKDKLTSTSTKTGPLKMTSVKPKDKLSSISTKSSSLITSSVEPKDELKSTSSKSSPLKLTFVIPRNKIKSMSSKSNPSKVTSVEPKDSLKNLISEKPIEEAATISSLEHQTGESKNMISQKKKFRSVSKNESGPSPKSRLNEVGLHENTRIHMMPRKKSSALDNESRALPRSGLQQVAPRKPGVYVIPQHQKSLSTLDKESHGIQDKSTNIGLPVSQTLPLLTIQSTEAENPSSLSPSVLENLYRTFPPTSHPQASTGRPSLLPPSAHSDDTDNESQYSTSSESSNLQRKRPRMMRRPEKHGALSLSNLGGPDNLVEQFSAETMLPIPISVPSSPTQRARSNSVSPIPTPQSAITLPLASPQASPQKPSISTPSVSRPRRSTICTDILDLPDPEDFSSDLLDPNDFASDIPSPEDFSFDLPSTDKFLLDDDEDDCGKTTRLLLDSVGSKLPDVSETDCVSDFDSSESTLAAGSDFDGEMVRW